MNYRVDIAMVVPGLPFDGESIKTKSLGGSETAGYYMARELAKRGHRVTMFCKGTPGLYEGVFYQPLTEWQKYGTMQPHDVAIIQRVPELFSHRLSSKLNILWCHDLAMVRNDLNMKGAAWNIDEFFVVSEFMKKQYHEVYGEYLPTFATRNGVDLSLFPRPQKREPKKIMYMARPERGVDILLQDIMPRLLKADPEITLHLCSYDNQVDHLRDFYNHIDNMIRAYGDRVKWIGNLSKEQLYKELATTRVYTYPGPSQIQEHFVEVSCIAAMECMAAGVPVVASNRGALPETLHPDACTLIDGSPYSAEYHDAFAQAVLTYINDESAWQRASSAGLQRAANLGWEAVAEQWETRIGELFDKINNSPERLASHFITHSEIEGAVRVLADIDTPQATKLMVEIDDKYHFTRSQESFDQHYFSHGQATDERLSSAVFTKEHFLHTEEKRFHMMAEYIQKNNIKSILDYGCGHGWCALYLANRFPDLKITGIDVDPNALKWARKFADDFAPNPGHLTFLTFLAGVSGHFDLGIISEVLEHVINPIEVTEQVEALCDNMLITVPYGPAEYGTPNWFIFRNHIREYEPSDLRDMFGKKPKIQLFTIPERFCTETGEAVGFFYFTYESDKQPLGEIDFDRKLKIQRPRQTVSANIMAGPNSEDTLHWCLRSIQNFVDETIIVDCGMSEEALRIANQYACKIVPFASPREVGFETPRNRGLAHCTMDWVLWIDTDERFLNGPHVHKYLRDNMFNGYSVRQHHFACDTKFNPDLPVRLFRNKEVNGKRMKWWGMIHEHPELALNEGPGMTVVLGDVDISHVGYLNESTRRDRFNRNYPLLQKDMLIYPDRMLQKHFICRDNILLCQYELEQNGGKITERVKQLCEETILLYRKYFRGKPGFCGTDTIQYYSQALRLLGRGAEVAYQLEAGKTEAKPNGATTYRFESKEDLMEELTALADTKLNPLLSRWY